MKKITERCTNCGACLHSCPKNAISFKKVGTQEFAVIDEDKCINCGKCFKMCPSNVEKEDNKVVIKVGRIKSAENIQKSTSGGIFGELARYILGKDGIVYGAVYSEDFKEVYHTRCDSIENLNPILKSKYVRSDLKDTFKEVQKDLKNKKTVLYSGTPCQIAGLKRFLQKDYENLYTVDIVCHGTPSPAIWKKYANLLEKQEDSKITKVDFRYFEKEDPSKNFYLKFENGTEKKQSLYDTSYGRAFLIGLINGECCGSCKFNNFRNYSEITIGDAWGYENKNYPHKNSLFFLNNEKGKKLYSKIKDNVMEFTDFDFEKMIPHCYPIIHPTFTHYNAKRVDMNAKNIDEELWHWLDEKNGLVKDTKGVGILNFHYENYNYGANLVAYSLSEAVKKLGYHPYVIDFDPFASPDPITRYKTMGMLEFRQKHLNMTPRFQKREELEILNDYFDMYIVGSDQVWRKFITQDNVYTYFLDFAKNKNKISYSASFGKDIFEGNDVEKLRCASLLSSFYKISVRENDALQILRNDFNTYGTVVLDPTLLLTREEYEKIIDDEYEDKIDVGVYYVMDHDNVITEDPDLKKLFPKKKIVNIKGEYVEKPYGKVFKYNSVSKWIDGFRKAEYIVTDSYHGLVFSIIFGKKVICVGKNSASLSRFITLKENLSRTIDNVMYASLKDVKDIEKTMNYKEVYGNLERMRIISMNFLENNLGRKKVKEADPFYQQMEEIAKRYDEIETKLKEKTEEVDSMTHSRSWKLTKPIRYLKWVVKRNG